MNRCRRRDFRDGRSDYVFTTEQQQLIERCRKLLENAQAALDESRLPPKTEDDVSAEEPKILPQSKALCHPDPDAGGPTQFESAEPSSIDPDAGGPTQFESAEPSSINHEAGGPTQFESAEPSSIDHEAGGRTQFENAEPSSIIWASDVGKYEAVTQATAATLEPDRLIEEPELAEPTATEPLEASWLKPPFEATAPAQGRSRDILLAISLGALLATATITAGAVLRAELDDSTRGPSYALAPIASDILAVPSQLLAVHEPVTAQTTVHLRVGADLAPEERQQIEKVLADAGYVVVVREMPFSISRSRVAYFRREDRASAEALVEALREKLEGVELRDYRTLVPNPEPGRLDLWIES